MKTELQALLFTLLLLASMVSVSESSFGGGRFQFGGANEGKRSKSRKVLQESSEFPLGARSIQIAEEGDMMRVRRDEICELAKRTC